MNIIKKITGKLTRKPSDRAQLIALPKAVMIYTEEGSVVLTPRLAKDIQANLGQITERAENFDKEVEDKS
ncbi:MAG: hypothetical protein HY865_22320 [Chloroflexi bacterium]|nr:hypothetical protein [Chloroflexota bacterium]